MRLDIRVTIRVDRVCDRRWIMRMRILFPSSCFYLLVSFLRARDHVWLELFVKKLMLLVMMLAILAWWWWWQCWVFHLQWPVRAKTLPLAWMVFWKLVDGCWGGLDHGHGHGSGAGSQSSTFVGGLWPFIFAVCIFPKTVLADEGIFVSWLAVCWPWVNVIGPGCGAQAQSSLA